jgi:hypothetical protein
MITNFRQHFAWDGHYSETQNNLAGKLLNASFGISYSPFNFPNSAIWTSTTYTAATTIAYMHSGSWINLNAKTGADARWIACRNFTVTGTTLS